MAGGVVVCFHVKVHGETPHLQRYPVSKGLLRARLVWNVYQPYRVNKTQCTDRLSGEGTEIQRLISNEVKTQTQTLRFPAEPWELASLLIYFKAFYFVGIKYLPTSMPVGWVCTWCPQRPKRSWEPLGLGLQTVMSHARYQESNPGPLHQQWLLSTVEPALQFYTLIYIESTTHFKCQTSVHGSPSSEYTELPLLTALVTKDRS